MSSLRNRDDGVKPPGTLSIASELASPPSPAPRRFVLFVGSSHSFDSKAKREGGGAGGREGGHGASELPSFD